MTHRHTRRIFLAGAVALLGGVARAAQPAWPDERVAGVFRIHADFSLDAYGELIDELAVLQDDLTAELGVAQPREEVHLFLFDKKGTYQAYLQQYFPKVPARKALYIKGRGPGMVFAYRNADLAVDVRHESTHALLHASIDEIPLWLDEGLAEYFEVSPASRVAKNPYVSGVRWNVRLGYVPPLADLERLRELSEMGKNEYRDAWAWVHYMLHGGNETRAVLKDYLRQLAEGQDAGSLKTQLERRVANIDEGYATHFRRWKVETP